MSKNSTISRSVNDPLIQSTFDGTTLVFNFDDKTSLPIPTNIGIEVNRTHFGVLSKGIYWNEGNQAETTAPSLESLPFSSLSSWKVEKFTPSILNIDFSNLIDSSYSANDGFNIGSNGSNISLDHKTVQTRTTSAITNSKIEDLGLTGPQDRNSIEGAFFINPFNGNLYLGDQWTSNTFQIRLKGVNVNTDADNITLNSNLGTSITSSGNVDISGDDVNVIATSSFTVNGAEVSNVYRQASQPTNVKNNDIWIDANKNLWVYDSSNLTWIDLYDFGTF